MIRSSLSRQFPRSLRAFSSCPRNLKGPDGSLKEGHDPNPGSQLSPKARKPLLVSKSHKNYPFIEVSKEVHDAVSENRPVVALESTIYTHGFPYPDNHKLALKLEEVVRQNGGIPATIGVLDGVARVGLTREEIGILAEAATKPGTMKVSRRDLPYILGMGYLGHKMAGGTTIAGTIILAARAGIKVFGTGGLGGVHRGGQDTMDISADLSELGRTPLAVISSGCKSFLDIPRTLEYLETQGVAVCTFADGRKGKIDFPAFYTRDSGVESPLVIQNAREAAAMIYHHASGLLFANPIPEEFSMPKDKIDEAINQAVKEAAEQGFHGHSNTPFILSRIKELTQGNSIPANTALIESNVTIATKVSVELSRLRAESSHHTNVMDGSSRDTLGSTFMPAEQQKTPKIDLIVFGSVAVDISCDYSPTALEPVDGDFSAVAKVISPALHTSNRAVINQSIGGVGHNVALATQRIGGDISVRLSTLVGSDSAGGLITSNMQSEGLNTGSIHALPLQEGNRTPQYVAFNDTKKDLIFAMADMSIYESNNYEYHKLCQQLKEQISPSLSWIVIDANWNWNALDYFLNWAKQVLKVKVAFEPVSVNKSERLFQKPPNGIAERFDIFPNHRLDLATPNQQELGAIHASASSNGFFSAKGYLEVFNALGIPSPEASRERFIATTGLKLTDSGTPFMSVMLLPYIHTILTKLGADGVLMTSLLSPLDERLTNPAEAPYIPFRNTEGNSKIGGVYMRLFPAAEVTEEVVSVNGVGDTFLGVVMAGLTKGAKLDEKLIHLAQKGAVMTLKSKSSVSERLGELERELNLLDMHKPEQLNRRSQTG
ncbi:hypothetical protein B7494_g3973 [Chlorociboria aeruginascens]|nr:hypothetical protein B7494_g3973 [Chlorociboria aeruginascens]